MRTIVSLTALAIMFVSFFFLPDPADYASWTDAQARSQIANQILADNMHHMR